MIVHREHDVKKIVVAKERCEDSLYHSSINPP
jgi:hypothetical protein